MEALHKGGRSSFLAPPPGHQGSDGMISVDGRLSSIHSSSDIMLTVRAPVDCNVLPLLEHAGIFPRRLIPGIFISFTKQLIFFPFPKDVNIPPSGY